MKAISTKLLLMASLTAGSASAAPLTFYVSPDGNDRWSGRMEKPAADGRDGPFATLPAAVQAARNARQDAALVREGISILLRNGNHVLAQPITLTAEDSGSSVNAPLTIAAFPGDQPLLSGGRRITGWKPVPGKPNLWQTEISEVREGKWHFRSLFVNGHRQQRARTPNEGFFRIEGASPQDKPVKLKFKSGDIKKEWADAGDVEVIALLAWADIRMFIRSVDEASRVATLSTDPRPSNKENNARYYIENAPDGLDAPGEWYLDRKTGVVTCWPLPGVNLAEAEAIAGNLDDLLVFQGDFAGKKPVHHVVLRGLTFGYSDWSMSSNGYADTQAAIAVRGDVRAEAAVDCVVEDCTFAHLSGYALELGRGCQRWRVARNEMFDLGGGGIRIGEPAKRQEPFAANHSHVVTDNHLHHLGVIYPPAVGVFILQSGSNRVAHNHIHHLYYTAVSVGWNWGYQETPCRDNVIEYNHMHDVGQFMLSDMGAVYTLGIQKGTAVRNNLIHDVNAFTYGGWGLYPDEGSTDIVWENNVVYRCKSAGFHQHYGRENIVRNNIFAFNKENQLMRTREEQHISFICTNNIVYYDSGNLLGSHWKNNNYRMGGNVYFDARAGADLTAMKFSGATWDQWRERGHDLNSIIADPLFIAPDRLDFRLKPESPALKLGFRPIDLGTVGIRTPQRGSQK
ncbi:MAG: right-handed parallel beta-helix repeat-containing protein [Verrucomicrobia bacterium]|nr:right-handed parallel beta-helix repeat-containing protein [Verrucomicrobiota bacterium]